MNCTKRDSHISNGFIAYAFFDRSSEIIYISVYDLNNVKSNRITNIRNRNNDKIGSLQLSDIDDDRLRSANKLQRF